MEEKATRPVAVVECKALATPLDEAAYNETFDYAEKLGCAYCLLTNGEEGHWFYVAADSYVELDAEPTYREMLKGHRRSAGATS